MADPLVVIIIINNNRRDDTLACLSSLRQSLYPNQKIIVLDNNSSDGSTSDIESKYPEVQIIPLAENLGFAGNNNIGIRLAVEQGADWLFILNEDTIVDPYCITNLVAEGEKDPNLGMLGPLVFHHDEPDIIQSAGGILGKNWNSTHIAMNEVDRGQITAPHPVDFISGCGILVRRAVVKQTGMLDERFFCYYEETEWCMRARGAGWNILNVPQAKMWHKGVQRDYHPKPYITYYLTRNRFLMLYLHHAPLPVWVGSWLQVIRNLISWTIKPKWRSMRNHRNAMWRGILDFLRHRWGQMPA